MTSFIRIPTAIDRLHICSQVRKTALCWSARTTTHVHCLGMVILNYRKRQFRSILSDGWNNTEMKLKWLPATKTKECGRRRPSVLTANPLLHYARPYGGWAILTMRNARCLRGNMPRRVGLPRQWHRS